MYISVEINEGPDMIMGKWHYYENFLHTNKYIVGESPFYVENNKETAC